MKTITEIKAEQFEIVRLSETLRPQLHDEAKQAAVKRSLNQHRSRMAFLNEICLYLKSEPSQDFCEQELARLKAKITLINKSFDIWNKQYLSPKTISDDDRLAIYKKSVNYSTIKTQIDHLEFILDI